MGIVRLDRVLFRIVSVNDREALVVCPSWGEDCIVIPLDYIPFEAKPDGYMLAMADLNAKSAETMTYEILEPLEVTGHELDDFTAMEQARKAKLPQFPSEVEAHKYFRELTKDLDYVDNVRFAYVGNEIQEYHYRQAQEKGCCGFLDVSVMVGDNEFLMGCNYGH